MDNPERTMGRREFLKLMGAAGLKFVLDPTEIEQLLLPQLEPNPHVSIVGLSLVPESIFKHRPDESLLLPINFCATYQRNSPDHLNKDSKSGGDLWGYGQGIREALTRGQPVFLVLEFPGETDQDVTLEDWKEYVSTLAQRFRGANFILGNEVNIELHRRWKNNPDLFAKYYLAAAEKIRQLSPNSLVLMYGEAYFGHGETLRQILFYLCQKPTRHPAVPIDGLCFHFYDDKVELLPARVELYRQIGREFGLPTKFYLTELGIPEAKVLTSEEHCRLLAQNLAVALALASEGELEYIFWQTAFSISNADPHSLTYFDKSSLKLKPAFVQFLLITKLLHHNVVLSESGGVYRVTGETSNHQKAIISWGPQQRLSINLTRAPASFLGS